MVDLHHLKKRGMIKVMSHMVMAVLPVDEGRPEDQWRETGVVDPANVLSDFLAHGVDSTSSE